MGQIDADSEISRFRNVHVHEGPPLKIHTWWSIVIYPDILIVWSSVLLHWWRTTNYLLSTLFNKLISCCHDYLTSCNFDKLLHYADKLLILILVNQYSSYLFYLLHSRYTREDDSRRALFHFLLFLASLSAQQTISLSQLFPLAWLNAARCYHGRLFKFLTIDTPLKISFLQNSTHSRLASMWKNILMITMIWCKFS